MRFNLDDYIPVAVRILAFWKDHPEGRIYTELVSTDEKRFIFKSSVYRHRDDQYPTATGWAEEIIGASPVNKTSALENCESGSLGRALRNMGYETEKPSREEMAKVNRAEAAPSEPPAIEDKYVIAHRATLEAAKDLAELDKAAAAIAELNLHERNRTILREAYLTNKKRVSEVDW